jgi:alkylation response protein AidB-like acyl-CoA dehydrogenase
MDITDVFEHRRADYTFDDDQRALADAAKDLFPEAERVRLRILGAPYVSADVADRVIQFGILASTLSVSAGGDGASFCDLIPVTEQFGRAVAPYPFVEMVVAARALARCADSELAATTLGRLLSGELRASTALIDLALPQLLPGGAGATVVIGARGSDLVLATMDEPLESPPNHGDQPIGRWSGNEPVSVLLSGAEAADVLKRIRREWRILTASALTGLLETALRSGVEFATTRLTRGVPIGALQAVSHSLADVEIRLKTARNLARKAAWYAEFEPGCRPEFAPLALWAAGKAAREGSYISSHVQGGLGVALEADITLLVTRARSWSSIGGSLDDLAVEAGAILIERARSTEHQGV